MLENVFVYWTLMESDVQKKVIWKSIEWTRDVLFWFIKSKIEINWNIYPIIVKDNTSKKWINGLVLEVNNKDLKKLDEYETNAYIREKVILKSGNEVWVYKK